MVQKSPANSKAKIFVGDTFPKVFEHRISDPSNINSARGMPGTVTEAYAQVYNTTSAEYLPIGGAGIFTEACTITPPTLDQGSLVSYVVDSEWTAEEGDFALFITFEYEDNQVTTLKFKFRVTGKR